MSKNTVQDYETICGSVFQKRECDKFKRGECPYSHELWEEVKKDFEPHSEKPKPRLQFCQYYLHHGTCPLGNTCPNYHHMPPQT